MSNSLDAGRWGYWKATAVTFSREEKETLRVRGYSPIYVSFSQKGVYESTPLVPEKMHGYTILLYIPETWPLTVETARIVLLLLGRECDKHSPSLFDWSPTYIAGWRLYTVASLPIGRGASVYDFLPTPIVARYCDFSLLPPLRE